MGDRKCWCRLLSVSQPVSQCGIPIPKLQEIPPPIAIPYILTYCNVPEGGRPLPRATQVNCRCDIPGRFPRPAPLNSVGAASVIPSSCRPTLKAQLDCDCSRDQHPPHHPSHTHTEPVHPLCCSTAMRGGTRCQSPIHLRDTAAEKLGVYGKGA